MSENNNNNNESAADRLSRPDRPRRPNIQVPPGALRTEDILLMGEQLLLARQQMVRERRDQMQLEVLDAERELLIIAARISELGDGVRVSDRNGLLVRVGDVVCVYDEVSDLRPNGFGLVTTVSREGVDVRMRNPYVDDVATFQYHHDCVAKDWVGFS